MPVNDQEPAEKKNDAAPSPRRRRRFVTRRNAIIAGIAIGLGAVALILLAVLSYRLGYIDSYIAGQIKNTLATYGVREGICSFHTSLSPQTVVILDLDIYS